MAMIADWIQLGEHIFYKKPEIYQMEWKGGLNLTDFMVAAAPLGGPVALTRDGSKRSGISPSKTLIFIFSSSGYKISSIKWEGNSLVYLGWSSSEDLICVQDDGAVTLFDIFGTYIHTFNFGQEVKESLVHSVQIFSNFQETGIAVLTKSNRFFVINNIKEPKAKKYSDFPNSHGSPILAWNVFREERSTYIFASQEKNLWSITNQENQLMNLEWSDTGSCIVAIAVSSNSRHAALYSDKGSMWVGSADLYTKYCEYTSNKSSKPKHLCWCGTGAVCLQWEITLELISVNGESTTIYLDDPASHLIQEIDSIRILNSTTHDLLQKVSRVAVNTMGIGSMSPGALLFEASQGFQEGSTRATDCLGMIKDSVGEAVTHCLQSAQHEFSPDAQKALLKAAFFGKTFLTEIEPDSFKMATTWLRVLNAIRDPVVGLPLTWNQLEWMSIPVLLDRLVLRRMFPLAMKIASYLKVPESEGSARILAHWACYKVNQPSQKGDEQIALEINAKLGYKPGISYTDIAKRANKAGRRLLAVKLIEYECRLNQQVAVLVSLGEDQTALKRALKSGDSDLIYTVLRHLRKKLSLAEFLMTIRNFPVAQSVHLRNCMENDVEQYRDILVQEDDFHGQALLRIREAYQPKRTDTQLASLQSAVECFRKAKQEWAAQMTEEQVKLYRAQIRLEEILQREFVGKPLHDTLSRLLKDRQNKEAEKLKSEFKVTDKKFCWIKVIALAESSQWNELVSLSKTKKLAIGHEVFVDVCLRLKKPDEAKQYLPKVKEDKKVDYHIKCGLLEEAAKLAEDMRSASGLSMVANACGPQHQPLLARVQKILESSSLK